ncbi:MAG: hypothetical protein JPMHGGIA_02452 [Saprospiraceae bacterium]|nr:hypothetical protein [Saprospiraceae bacterium]
MNLASQSFVAAQSVIVPHSFLRCASSCFPKFILVSKLGYSRCPSFLKVGSQDQKGHAEAAVSCERQMKKEFAINAALLLGSNMLIKVYYLLGIDRNFQLLMGTQEYGLYYGLFNFTLLFQFINDFGLQNLASRYVSQNGEKSLEAFRSYGAVKWMLSAVYLLVVAVACWLGGYPGEWRGLILHLAANQVLVSVIYFTRAGIAGLGHYRQDSFFSVFDRFLLIGMGTAVLWLPSLRGWVSASGFAWMQTLSLGVTWLSAAVYLRGKGVAIWPDTRMLLAVRKTLLPAIPFAAIYLLGSVYNKVDSVLLQRCLPDGTHHAGVYAASQRLFEAFGMFSLALAGLLLAMFSRLHSEREKLSGLFKLSVKWLLVGTIIVCTTGFCYAPEIVRLLYHTSDPYWYEPFSWIMLAFLPASLNYILGAFYQSVHQEWRLAGFYLWAAVCCLVLNGLFIPQGAAVAAARVAVVVHGSLFLIQAIDIRLRRLVDITRDFVLFSVLFAGMSWLIALGVMQLDVDWKLRALLSGGLIVLLAFAFRMVSLVEMRRS